MTGCPDDPPPTTDLPPLPQRRVDASKRDHGRAVIVGGSPGMAGAPALTASGALRSGAGLVELLVPRTVTEVAAGFDPCVMTFGLAADDDGGFAEVAVAPVIERAAAGSALAVGPGIGRSSAVERLVGELWRRHPGPAVFDADALWSLARMPREVLRDHHGPRIVTPHAGEMLRLAGRPASTHVARAWLEGAAEDLARAADLVVVLKGPGTLVVGPATRCRNQTGNPGMATAGTGDVLTGVVAGLLAQGLEPASAARLAAWVHGRAGDAAAADLGMTAMTASDLLARLHVAFRELEEGRTA